MITASDFAAALGLEELSPDTRKVTMPIVVKDLCHPGMQFAGFFEVFANSRPQVIGKTEMAYFTGLPRAVRRVRLERYFSYDMPCVIIARGMDCPEELLEGARAKGIPVYRTREITSEFSVRAIQWLDRKLAPSTNCHGVLLSIYGSGVLITGESGVGKSECALELIRRGHALVSDDVVHVHRYNDRLFGESPDIVRDFMELRGVGIVDIKALYGIGSVERSEHIDLIIHLESWSPEYSFDRTGAEKKTQSILGVEVPRIELPVRPGRNLAIIVEVAVRNFLLKQDGYNALDEIRRRNALKFNQAD